MASKFLGAERVKALIDNPAQLQREIVALSNKPTLGRKDVVLFFSSFHPDKLVTLSESYRDRGEIINQIANKYLSNTSGGARRHRTVRVRSQRGGGGYESWKDIKNPQIRDRIIQEILGALSSTAQTGRRNNTARRAQEEARRQAEEAARRQAEEAARRQAEEAARRQAEEAARRQAEEAARRQAEEAARRAQEEARRQAEASAKPVVDYAILEIPESSVKLNLNSRDKPNKILFSSDMLVRVQENPLIISITLVPETRQIIQHIYLTLLNQPGINSGGATGIVWLFAGSPGGQMKMLVYSFKDIPKSPKNIKFQKTINNTSLSIQQLAMPLNCNVFKPLKKKSEFSADLRQYSEQIQQSILAIVNPPGATSPPPPSAPPTLEDKITNELKIQHVSWNGQAIPMELTLMNKMELSKRYGMPQNIYTYLDSKPGVDFSDPSVLVRIEIPPEINPEGKILATQYFFANSAMKKITEGPTNSLMSLIFEIPDYTSGNISIPLYVMLRSNGEALFFLPQKTKKANFPKYQVYNLSNFTLSQPIYEWRIGEIKRVVNFSL
jgi:flagellar biosynthesis GTPase FlhF